MRLISTLTLLMTAVAAQASDLTVTVLDRNGKPLADAVVLVDSAVQGPRPAMVMEASIAQEKLRFVPTVSVVGLGAKVSFSNLDTWDHHVILGLMGAGGVYVDPGQNTQFRLAGRVGNKAPSSDSKVLSQPGAYLLGCHIHGSMGPSPRAARNSAEASMTSGSSSTASTCRPGSRAATPEVMPEPTPRKRARFGSG